MMEIGANPCGNASHNVCHMLSANTEHPVRNKTTSWKGKHLFVQMRPEFTTIHLACINIWFGLCVCVCEGSISVSMNRVSTEVIVGHHEICLITVFCLFVYLSLFDSDVSTNESLAATGFHFRSTAVVCVIPRPSSGYRQMLGILA